MFLFQFPNFLLAHKFLQMRLILLFVFLLFHLKETKIQYMVPSKIESKKFSKILLPFGNKNLFDAELFNDNIFIAPTSFLIDTKSIRDLCQIKEEVKILQPEFWNNSMITNPCEKYFCSNEVPYFLSINMNTNLSLSNRLDALNTHIAVNRLCSLCESNLTLNFNEYLKNNTCKWFDRSCEKGYCTKRSTCIPCKKEYNLCYLPERDLFMARDDFTHEYLFFIYYSFIPYILCVVSFILLICDIVFLIIPQSIYLFQYLRNKEIEKAKKIRTLFNLKNFIRIIVCTLHLSTFVASFVDSINLISQRFYVISNIYCASIDLLAFNFMFVEW